MGVACCNRKGGNGPTARLRALYPFNQKIGVSPNPHFTNDTQCQRTNQRQPPPQLTAQPSPKWPFSTVVPGVASDDARRRSQNQASFPPFLFFMREKETTLVLASYSHRQPLQGSPLFVEPDARAAIISSTKSMAVMTFATVSVISSPSLLHTWPEFGTGTRGRCRKKPWLCHPRLGVPTLTLKPLLLFRIGLAF
ncbi:hypothetical protein V8G54_006719 [Vigna mungo]|uniref:Uncharacterized protein n=1 Tax=Vigna mungo TaxID=3915 RepID=A0AAQ3S6P4_VIGMU